MSVGRLIQRLYAPFILKVKNKITEKMKHCIIIFLSLLISNIFATRIVAQDYSKTNLHFVYIAHETSTPVNKLCERLRTLRDDAIEVEDAFIIYLSDGRQSLLSLTNLKDNSQKGRDQESAYVDIIAALQDANSHDVIAREDRKNIYDLFDEFNFVNEQGHLLFSSVVMDFYVGPGFWTLGNDEKIIAHLFTAFKAANFPRDIFSFNVYKPKGQTLSHEKGMPFGDNNIDGINSKLSIFEY